MNKKEDSYNSDNDNDNNNLIIIIIIIIISIRIISGLKVSFVKKSSYLGVIIQKIQVFKCRCFFGSFCLWCFSFVCWALLKQCICELVERMDGISWKLYIHHYKGLSIDTCRYQLKFMAKKCLLLTMYTKYNWWSLLLIDINLSYKPVLLQRESTCPVYIFTLRSYLKCILYPRGRRLFIITNLIFFPPHYNENNSNS